MASIKNLKKDINYTLGDIIEECYVWELLNPKEDTAKTEAIIDEAIQTFDALLDKVHVKNIDNKKTHFKAISLELESKAKELIKKVNSL
ncbi:hypothetical protein [Tenacibaculum sp. SG-28]|uniref:hypothetical protein n=1 Tax=Tenacibaculum sp. SG-28 TaxID=754426 RepID=UPI000CF45A65|nr:hypothetical protein [Tenacibaculum sp. SG-28]PQJ23060.1 hypothetical protein BSU00_02025 [Tenacibaculum sp. SG-28]